MNDESWRQEVEAAIELLKLLRRVDEECGVRNSRIAFDVALALYEREPPTAMTVDQISDTTGHSGPTIRLVLRRLSEFGATESRAKRGKTQFYGLTSQGRQGFEGYIEALRKFRDTGRAI